ncbi:hypothetical protein HDC92_005116, partial [Pedobacter sp. AK017]|nr:hypothetical protein [Pedobacter sp. AK017]
MFTKFTKLIAYLVGDLTWTSRDNARVLRPVLGGTEGANPSSLLG